MTSQPVADVTLPDALYPLLVALVLITLLSLPQEPARQKLGAVFLAGAGGAYLSGGGFGAWEFAFCAAVTALAV
jgi:hypothetical protein